jgi:hypothetical protein
MSEAVSPLCETERCKIRHWQTFPAPFGKEAQRITCPLWARRYIVMLLGDALLPKSASRLAMPAITINPVIMMALSAF